MAMNCVEVLELFRHHQITMNWAVEWGEELGGCRGFVNVSSKLTCVDAY